MNSSRTATTLNPFNKYINHQWICKQSQKLLKAMNIHPFLMNLIGERTLKGVLSPTKVESGSLLHRKYPSIHLFCINLMGEGSFQSFHPQSLLKCGQLNNWMVSAEAIQHPINLRRHTHSNGLSRSDSTSKCVLASIDTNWRVNTYHLHRSPISLPFWLLWVSTYFLSSLIVRIGVSRLVTTRMYQKPPPKILSKFPPSWGGPCCGCSLMVLGQGYLLWCVKVYFSCQMCGKVRGRRD